LVYNSFYIVPEVLRKNMLATVLNEMEDTMVMFDDKGKCVYLNNKWHENDVVMDMKQEEFHEAVRKAHDKQSAICVNYGSVTHYYEDRYNELRDKNGKYTGCYYIFRDISEERRLLHAQHYIANFDKLRYNKRDYGKLKEGIPLWIFGSLRHLLPR